DPSRASATPPAARRSSQARRSTSPARSVSPAIRRKSPRRHGCRCCSADSSTSPDARRAPAPNGWFRPPFPAQGATDMPTRAEEVASMCSMAEVLVMLPDVLAAENGQTYTAQAVGAHTPLGQWEAWIEFIPLDGGPPATSPRETTQPNRVAAVYWATGLT